jgi:hypothetical protein
MPQTISNRMKKQLAIHPPGTICLPKIGLVHADRIESFASDSNYCWVKFRGQQKPILLSWPIAQFVRQLPDWRIEKLPQLNFGAPRKKLIPAHL